METKKSFTLGSILTDSWNIFIKNIFKFLMITCIVYIPINSLYYIFPVKTTAGTFSQLFNVATIIGFLFSVIATIAICFVVKSYLQKKNISWKAALKRSFEKWPYVIITQIILTVILLLSFVLLIIPGIIAAIYLIFTIYSVALNDKFGLDALKYSYSLVKKRWWKTLGYLIFFGILSGLIGLVMTIPSSLFESNDMMKILFDSIISFINSFFLVASITLFLNYERSDRSKK